jgi:hypothetical protein
MKKIHIKESDLNNNFNNKLELMSNLEKRVNGIENNNEMQIDPSILDSELEDDDDKYAKMFIAAKLADAQDILSELSDYLQHSDYAIEKGGEIFKRHLERTTNICNEIERFLDEQ